ncbi:MAG: hypothetical protein EPN64_13265 [Burkholderiaceae bacterium]|nr:MAG: hypothetical protein EPN64_13265 [Burkholderiaceae bacterium]
MYTESLFETEGQAASLISDEQLAREHRPFDDREVEEVLEDMPQALMESFIDSVRGFNAQGAEKNEAAEVDMYGETAGKDHKGRLSAKGRLMENLAWAFELYEDKPIVNFDWVCRVKECDPEHMKAMLSRAFVNEIKEFALAVYRQYPSVGRRIQRRMRGYVDIQFPPLH